MFLFHLIHLLDTVCKQHQQSEISFIFMSETENLCGTATLYQVTLQE